MREKILQTAFDLFMKHGIRKMSIHKLSKSLRISTKTVYKYFENKEALLEKVLEMFREQRFQTFEKVNDSSETIPLMLDTWYMAIKKEYIVNNKFYNDLQYYYPELESKSEKEFGHKYWIFLHQAFMKGIEDGVLQSNIMPLVAMEGISALYSAVARSEQFDKFGASTYQLFKNTIVPFIRGLCTPKGVIQLEEHIIKIKE